MSAGKWRTFVPANGTEPERRMGVMRRDKKRGRIDSGY